VCNIDLVVSLFARQIFEEKSEIKNNNAIDLEKIYAMLIFFYVRMLKIEIGC